ncbi:hypothetical protein K402DRAFT_391046 [Aulographum hederae CBS 113979]|uniref:Uncharacterized protein n=1 Tax=Aulographum hederae CBS 113979 TaxID=1176131 RepID=A0A6G1H8T8_9PEZI|nr:hypothetical protein K402DRAFT_391046 [Aulographum hederae CBS 113979]
MYHLNLLVIIYLHFLSSSFPIANADILETIFRIAARDSTSGPCHSNSDSAAKATLITSSESQIPSSDSAASNSPSTRTLIWPSAKARPDSMLTDSTSVSTEVASSLISSPTRTLIWPSAKPRPDPQSPGSTSTAPSSQGDAEPAYPTNMSVVDISSYVSSVLSTPTTASPTANSGGEGSWPTNMSVVDISEYISSVLSTPTGPIPSSTTPSAAQPTALQPADSSTTANTQPATLETVEISSYISSILSSSSSEIDYPTGLSTVQISEYISSVLSTPTTHSPTPTPTSSPALDPAPPTSVLASTEGVEIPPATPKDAQENASTLLSGTVTATGSISLSTSTSTTTSTSNTFPVSEPATIADETTPAAAEFTGGGGRNRGGRERCYGALGALGLVGVVVWVVL